MAHLQNTIISGSLTVLGQIDLPDNTTIGGKAIATQDAVQDQLTQYQINYATLDSEIATLSNSSIQIFSGTLDPTDSSITFEGLNSGDIYLKLQI